MLEKQDRKVVRLTITTGTIVTRATLETMFQGLNVTLVSGVFLW